MVQPARHPRPAVHPHTRGERAPAKGSRRAAVGPSPHPWGTREAAVLLGGLPRSIPTPVGNARPKPRPPCAPPVHPHTRGERIHLTLEPNLVNGPSPHPWGTLLDVLQHDHARRSIPTPVGNASPSRSSRARPSVHPHTRGERGGSKMLREASDGPSPHPWGTPTPRWCVSPRRRSIPTPVGNAGCRSPRPAGRPVHPHTRGERARHRLDVHRGHGPSPHPWGTPCGLQADELEERSIPTPVGNASNCTCPSACCTVHPHTRGER